VVRKSTIETALLLASSPAIGGPPFLTDDPVPVDYRHSELNVYCAYDESRDGSDTSFPAMEFNYGGLRDVQLHIGVPSTRSAPDGGPTQQGIGDVELGVKYRLAHESDSSPQIAVYPMAVLPTGDPKRGLGNGRTCDCGGASAEMNRSSSPAARRPGPSGRSRSDSENHRAHRSASRSPARASNRRHWMSASNGPRRGDSRSRCAAATSCQSHREWRPVSRSGLLHRVLNPTEARA
jgi:hypothetical protein